MKIINSTLEEICTKENKSIISGPFGSNIGKRFFVPSGVPVIRGNNLSLSFDKFYDDGFVFVTENKADELNCYAKARDLIFTAAGTIGQVGIIPDDCRYVKYVISNKQLRARIDESKIDITYAYYWFSSPWIQARILNNNKGSTVPLISLSEMKGLPISYPESLEEQRKIIKIVEEISRKIALNKRINAELEAMAKAIYDYWFVQFDFPDENGKPYRSSGGEMVWNEKLKREIPKGWEAVPFSEIVKKRTQTILDDKDKSAMFGIDLSIMPSNTMCLNQYGKANDFDSNRFRLYKYDLLFGSIRPYLRKAGFSAFDGVVNGTVLNFRNKAEYDYSFALCTLTSEGLFQYADIRSRGNGTRMPTINSTELLGYTFAYNPETVKSFSGRVSEYWKMIAANINQNFELANLRDWLLPMLMNGQVTVE